MHKPSCLQVTHFRTQLLCRITSLTTRAADGCFETKQARKFSLFKPAPSMHTRKKYLRNESQTTHPAHPANIMATGRSCTAQSHRTEQFRQSLKHVSTTLATSDPKLATMVGAIAYTFRLSLSSACWLSISLPEPKGASSSPRTNISAIVKAAPKAKDPLVMRARVCSV